MSTKKIQVNELRSHFHPDHWFDLKASGLSDETIQQAGIRSIPPVDINRILPSALADKVTSLLALPYPGNGFVRFKLFPPVKDKDRHSIRYFQHKNSRVHLYIPPSVEKILKDPSVPLTITEGEKKSLKATQEGIPTIGLGGVWNFKEGGNDGLIPDFDRIALNGRIVEITPDSDLSKNESIRLATYRLAGKLIERGAIVRIVRIPEAKDGTKMGLDDFLLTRTKDDYLALPRTSVTMEMVREIDRPPLPQLVSRLQGGAVSDLFHLNLEDNPMEQVGHSQTHPGCGTLTKAVYFVPKAGQGDKGFAIRYFCDSWNCPVCGRYLARIWKGRIMRALPWPFFSIIPAKNYQSYTKSANRHKIKYFAILDGTGNRLLILTDGKFKNFQPFNSLSHYEDTLDSFLKVEPVPLNGRKKIRHSKEFTKKKAESVLSKSKKCGEDLEMDQKEEKFIPFLVYGNDEMLQKLEQLGCEIEHDGEIISIRFSDEALRRFWAIANPKKVTPIFSLDDPFLRVSPLTYEF